MTRHNDSVHRADLPGISLLRSGIPGSRATDGPTARRRDGAVRPAACREAGRLP
jgi:hypothetical protein